MNWGEGVKVRKINLLWFLSLACRCNGRGVADQLCEPNGQCHCQPNYIGLQCEECAAGYYAYPTCSCTCGIFCFVCSNLIMIKVFGSLQDLWKSLFSSSQHAIVQEKALLMGHVTQRRVSACVILVWQDTCVTAALNPTKPFLIALVITK